MGINVLRGTGPTAINARKTQCKRGHPFGEANTRMNSKGQRVCRLCERAANQEIYRRRQEAKALGIPPNFRNLHS